MRMRVAFRFDASPEIGTGHAFRCLALAGALSSLGVQAVFVVRDLGFDVQRLIRRQGNYELYLLRAPEITAQVQPGIGPTHANWSGVAAEVDADQTANALMGLECNWVVVDHYAFDAAWHRIVCERLGCQIAVIDDLADRSIEASLIIDHNLHPDHVQKYECQIQHPTEILGGPRFALVKASYATAPRWSPRSATQSIGIFMGGSDALNMSTLAWRACRNKAGFAGQIEIVTTSANAQIQCLMSLEEMDSQLTLTVDSADLADFYARHLFQIGAGGGATWERCCIGAPTLAIVCADNQLLSVPILDAAGVVQMAGRPDQWRQVNEQDISKGVQRMLEDPSLCMELSRRSRELIDGLGARRVAEVLIGRIGRHS